MIPSLVAGMLLLVVHTGSTLHVDGVHGNDGHPGSPEQPLRTLQHAVEQAQPGDRIVLVPGQPPLSQGLVIHNQSGMPGKPITIEGNNNILIGSQPLPAQEWEKVGPGLFRHSHFLRSHLSVDGTLPPMVKRRFFLIINGVQERMGRSSKGTRPSLPQSVDLKPGQWTLCQASGHVYVALDPGDNLEALKIEAPIILNGVATRGTVNHWVIRNLHVTRFLNDGFNFHGQSRDITLTNCSAVECGDDGLSAHGTCVLFVDGFTASGNSTGICHVDSASTVNRRLTITDNHGVNLYLLGDGVHVFSESNISAKGAGIRLGHGDRDTLSVVFMDCVFDWPNNPDRGQLESFQIGTSLRLLHPIFLKDHQP